MNKTSSLSSSAAAVSFLLLLAVVSLHSSVAAFHMPCNARMDVDRDDCRYGTYIDYCGHEACSRAPDEACGGFFNMHGDCGNGLMCQCGRCVGCSTDTMQCSVHKQIGCDQ